MQMHFDLVTPSLPIKQIVSAPSLIGSPEAVTRTQFPHYVKCYIHLSLKRANEN